MKYTPVLALISLLATAISPVSAEAAVRKCTGNALSTAPFIQGKAMLMVDGIIVGELSETTPAATEYPPSTEVLSVSIVCLEHVSEAGPQVTQVVSLLTREGGVRLARQYLGELVELQQAYRTEHGRYAQDAVELRFFLRRAPMDMNMSASSSGWSANISMEGAACQVTVGRRGAVDGPGCEDA